MTKEMKLIHVSKADEDWNSKGHLEKELKEAKELMTLVLNRRPYLKTDFKVYRYLEGQINLLKNQISRTK